MNNAITESELAGLKMLASQLPAKGDSIAFPYITHNRTFIVRSGGGSEDGPDDHYLLPKDFGKTLENQGYTVKVFRPWYLWLFLPLLLPLRLVFRHFSIVDTLAISHA